jgi:hypothetical protein
MNIRNVFAVVHGPDDGKNEPKNYWKSCGIAFVNKDGSETVKLDLFPGVDIVIRDKEERKDDAPEPDGEVREARPPSRDGSKTVYTGQPRYRSRYGGHAPR